jgi:hypothetical protein
MLEYTVAMMRSANLVQATILSRSINLIEIMTAAWRKALIIYHLLSLLACLPPSLLPFLPSFVLFFDLINIDVL